MGERTWVVTEVVNPCIVVSPTRFLAEKSIPLAVDLGVDILPCVRKNQVGDHERAEEFGGQALPTMFVRGVDVDCTVSISTSFAGRAQTAIRKHGTFHR